MGDQAFPQKAPFLNERTPLQPIRRRSLGAPSLPIRPTERYCRYRRGSVNHTTKAIKISMDKKKANNYVAKFLVLRVLNKNIYKPYKQQSKYCLPSLAGVSRIVPK